MTGPLIITSLNQGKIFVLPFARADALARAAKPDSTGRGPVQRQTLAAQIAALLRFAHRTT